jgi:hypothetical protein
MWRACLGFLLLFPYLSKAQYVDTIQGKLTVLYNNPKMLRYSILAGGAFETQGMEGGVMIPSIFIDAHVKPLNWILLHGSISNQFQVGWQFQKIRDTRNMELGGRIYFSNSKIEKWRVFTAGNKYWNYDFNFPVRVDWRIGLSGAMRFGTGVFNSGVDPSTSVRFRNLDNNKTEFLENAAIPYSFSEVSAGFVVSTNSFMKLQAHLPTQVSKTRRIHTFTEFRIEAIFGQSLNYDTLITRRPAETATKYFIYNVQIQQKENWGLKLSGFFRRKWTGFKFEAGVRPGISYRFAGGERNSVLDRAYLTLGFGFGWM